MTSKTDYEIQDLDVWSDNLMGSGEQVLEHGKTDVVAVHGLGAHPYYTWVKKVPSKFDSTVMEEVMWLKDLLPCYAKNARILTFNYLSGGFADKKGVRTSLRELGERLLNTLHLDRQKINAVRRPIVFIGHSMGGLVIKQALVLASNRPNREAIKRSTAGVVFLGTPHGGSDIAGYGAFMAMLHQNDPTLLGSLKPTNQELRALSIDFAAGYKNLDITCFYEKLPAQYAKGLLKFEIVHQHSAVREGSNMMYLATDHSGLNKFWGHEDPNFKTVCSVVEVMVRDAPKIIQQNYDEPSQTTMMDSANHKMLGWFRPPDFGANHEDIFDKRHRETGEWFLQHSHFRTWLEGQNASDRILWCPGIPGSGKTILSSIVIDYLFQHKKEFEGNLGVAYVYCNHKEQQNQTAENLVSRLLGQLLQQLKAVPKYIEVLYEDHLKAGTRLGREESLRTLQSVAETFTKVFVVVDALDECDSATQDGFARPLTKLDFMHIMLTSRDLPHLERFLSSFRRITISAREADIRRYVEDRVRGAAELADFIEEDGTLLGKIVDTLAQRSCGMFLLTELHLKLLIELDNLRDVLQALEHLPRRLDDCYDDAIDRMKRQPGQHYTRAMQVLSWISLAFRPLTVTELRHALAVELDSVKLDASALPAVTRLISVCGGLVTVDRHSQVFRVVHETTQVYLERNRLKLFCEGQLEISKVCLTYLSFDRLANGPCSNDQELASRLHELPLFDYAARYWGDHVRQSQDVSIQRLSLHFLKDKAKIMSFVQRWRSPTIQGREFSQRNLKSLSGIHVASAFGIEGLILGLLEGGAHIDIQDEAGWTPLIWAVTKAHFGAVKLLLQKRADSSLGDKSGRLPIHHAAQRNYMQILKVLAAEKESHINQSNKFGEKPLHLASSEGRVEAVEFLLAKNAILDSPDRRGRTALHRSVQNQHPDITSLLLSKNANPSQYNLRKETALHLGAERGHLEIFQQLLAAFRLKMPEMRPESPENPHSSEMIISRALSDLQDKNRRTVLHLAAMEGHIDIVKLLLPGLIDSERIDKTGWTALDWAVGNGHLCVVDTLWEVRNKSLDNEHKSGDYLRRAAGKGDEKMVAYWLKQNENVDSHNRNDRRTALHFAVIKGRIGVALMLLDNGADFNFCDRNGLTPVESAALWHRRDCVSTLVKRGYWDSSHSDHHKRTLFHFVAQRGWTILVTLMLELHASPIAQDDKGRTPLHIAVINNKSETVEILVHDGRSVQTRDKDGWLASDWALWLGSPSLVTVLGGPEDPQIYRTKRFDAIRQRINIGIAQLGGDGQSDEETFLSLGKSAAYLGQPELARHLLVEHGRRYPAWICGSCMKPRKTPQQRNFCTICYDGDSCEVCIRAPMASLCHQPSAYIRVSYEGDSIGGQKNEFWIAKLEEVLQANDLAVVI